MSLLPSTVVGQQVIVGVCLVAFALACLAYRRLRNQNRRISTALNNMSQGLNMFDAQGRITLLNARYLEMYKLDPKVVKPGCTLKRLIEYRKETGLVSGDVDSYVQKILDGMAQGTSQSHYVQASDGRVVLAKNEALAGGGWVSTHEDVTEGAAPCRAGTRRHPQPGAAACDNRLRHRLVPSEYRETPVQRQQ
jgi:methyl-accepting chemotaxis protein